jgi:hypothetical protein
MAHVSPELSHGIAYDDTRHTDVAKRGGSGLGLTNEDVGLLRGWIVISRPVDGDILAQGSIKLIEYSYQQDVSYFRKPVSKERSG